MFMKNFKRVFVIISLCFALSLGAITTAFANGNTDAPATDGNETTTPEVTPGDTTEKDSVLADRLAAIEANTPLNQYELPIIQGPLTWEEGKPEVIGWKRSGSNVTTAWGQILTDVGVNDARVEYEENGNAHFVMRYDGNAEREWETKNGSIHTYPYINVNNRVQDNNLVIEFDITSFGEAYPVMSFEHSNVATDAGGKAQPRILDFKADGSISAALVGKNCMSGYELSAEEKARMNAVKLKFGEWTHMSLLYESGTGFITLYVDYEYIARWDTRPAGVSLYELTIFRYGTANPSFISGEVSIDNFIAYEGSYLRTPDLFDKMSEPERFIFYSNYATNTEAPSSDRITAYKHATKLIGEYYDNGEFIPAEDDSLDADALAQLNERLKGAVNGYNSFVTDGYATLYNAYIAGNLAKFGELVNAFLAKHERTLDSLGDRRTALSEIDDFLDACGEDILTAEDSDYLTIKGAYDTIVAQIKNDSSIVDFCAAVDRFYMSTKFGADVMQKHYQNAVDIYADVIDRSVKDADGFEKFAEAVELYEAGAELLAQKIREKNSKTIIDCISFIDEYTTVEQWNENYDYINRYVVIVRAIVNNRNDKDEITYDATVAGISEALAFFETVNDYFYGLLQQEHAEYIAEMLENYLAATGYVEKVGICAHIRAYIESADISLEHELVKPEVLRLYIYESELELYEDDYNEVLTQNTIIFKNTVNLMSTASGYAELLALYSRAQELYFAMNVGDESIAAELLIYDEMTFTLEAMEKASVEFLISVELLRAATTEEEKYAALVDCYISAANADMDYDGVAEAMEYYLAEYAAYNNTALAIASEIGAMNGAAVASVRANCGVDEIIAVIVKKISEEE